MNGQNHRKRRALLCASNLRLRRVRGSAIMSVDSRKPSHTVRWSSASPGSRLRLCKASTSSSTPPPPPPTTTTTANTMVHQPPPRSQIHRRGHAYITNAYDCIQYIVEDPRCVPVKQISQYPVQPRKVSSCPSTTRFSFFQMYV